MAPLGFPIPRRFIVLFSTILSLLVIYHFLAPSYAPLSRSSRLASYGSDSSSGDAADGYLSPASWLPWQSDTYDRPPEFDEDGQCLFLSPYSALSKEEKQRVEWMELEEVSAGVVRSKYASDGEQGGSEEVAEFDGFEDPDVVANATSKGRKSGTRPKGRSHPILKLLKQGEDKWNERINGQSKTLEEAVAKYVGKWNRQPPKGFDRWWQFATSVNVLLPDDHDAIMNALLPFYGLPIATLAERAAEAEDIVETFTLIVTDGKVELQWNDEYSRDTWWASRPRADSQINLMEPFLNLLPDLRATFTIHDQPSILLDYQRHRELVDAARRGKVSNHKNEADRHEQVWSRACAKDSPLVKGEIELPETDTFIERHTAAMDICQHPSYMNNHGMLLEEHDANMHPKPHTKLFPLFVPSKTTLNGDIPVTPIGRDGRRDDVGPDPEWSKKSGKLYWRGLATGLNHNKKGGAKWRQSHRERLHFLANDKTAANQEILSPIGNTGEVEYSRYPMQELGDYYMDVKLAGGHWQCDGEDGTCDEMNAEIEWAEKDPGERSNDFKYVFDTDGNAWSSRFPRLMASNNVVIKASVFPEWNTQSLPEWFAYVPSKMDYSDLYSIMAFFRGTPSGKGGHDEVARRIALNSQCWVERTWRREDMQSYMFLLYIEYARLISPDRDNGKMDFHLRPKAAHHGPVHSGASSKSGTSSSASSSSNGQTHAGNDISANIADKELSEGLKITLKDAHSPAEKVAAAVAEKANEAGARR